jgi:hypothetical protein
MTTSNSVPGPAAGHQDAIERKDRAMASMENLRSASATIQHTPAGVAATEDASHRQDTSVETEMNTITTPRHASTGATARWVALGSLIGPVVFTLAWVILGVLQPATLTSYGVMGGVSGAISNPISGLGVGPNALVFNVVAFVLCGLVQFVGVVGALQTTSADSRVGPRTVSALLLGLSPLGLAMAGVFTLESSVLLHTVGAGLLFATPVVSFAVAGQFFRHIPRWRTFGTGMLVGSPATLVLLVIYAASFDQAAVAAGLGIAGLTERILAIEVQAWYVVMGWLTFRRS